VDLGTNILQGLLALIFVLALIALLTAVARRFGFGYRAPGRHATRRLSIAEVMPVDARRRLLLVRRDGVEHLILLGSGTGADLLVESNIPVPGFAAALASARDQASDRPAESPPP
jgi:flagellar protein FliO/FliZ